MQTNEGWQNFTAGWFVGGLSGVGFGYVLTKVSSCPLKTTLATKFLPNFVNFILLHVLAWRSESCWQSENECTTFRSQLWTFIYTSQYTVKCLPVARSQNELHSKSKIDNDVVWLSSLLQIRSITTAKFSSFDASCRREVLPQPRFWDCWSLPLFAVAPLLQLDEEVPRWTIF